MATEYAKQIKAIEKKLSALNYTPMIAHILAGVLYELRSRPQAERDNAIRVIVNLTQNR